MQHINNTNKSHSSNEYLKQSYNMRNSIITSLNELLNSFNVSNSYEQERQALCMKMQQNIDLSNFSSYLEEVSHFIINLQKDTKTKNKSFFDQVYSQLKSINSFFIKESNNILEAHSSDVDFQDTFSDSMGDMAEALEGFSESDSVEDIRYQLMQQINTVNQHLSSYKDVKQEQIQSMHKKIEGYVSKIDRLKLDYREMASHFNNKMDELNTEKQTDSLTNVLNRDGYKNTLKSLYSNYVNNEGDNHLNFVVCDIDLFKSVNDEFGHHAGDKALAKIASLLKNGVRGDDVVCRMGGEEFAILMPDAYYTDSLKVIERLRRTIENTKFTYEEKTLNITCSFGLAYFSSDDIPTEVYKRADEACYAAKKNGRNKVYLNDPLEHDGLISYDNLTN
jgi:diguanylate cyclase